MMAFQSIIWNNDSSNTTENTFTIGFEDIILTGENTTITVAVKNSSGCENTDEILIEVFKVIVYDVLTPNGDGENDLWVPDPKGWAGINEHTMIVFNRWGEKVWESGDFPSGWDGKQNGKYVAEGSYFWVLEVFYGTDDVKKIYKGSLTVLGTNN